MRYIHLIVLLIVLSCKGKEKKSSEVISSSPKCDSSFISISFHDNINDSLVRDGIMVVFLEGVEEDIESIFTDPQRGYALDKAHHLCLDRASLYSKYYADVNDTLQGAVYCKGVGYSYPFDIIVGASSFSVDLKLAFDSKGRQYPK
jgi:hypothetical protein